MRRALLASARAAWVGRHRRGLSLWRTDSAVATQDERRRKWRPALAARRRCALKSGADEWGLFASHSISLLS